MEKEVLSNIQYIYTFSLKIILFCTYKNSLKPKLEVKQKKNNAFKKFTWQDSNSNK